MEMDMEQIQEILNQLVFYIGSAEQPTYAFRVLNLLYLLFLLLAGVFVFRQYRKVIALLITRFIADFKEQEVIYNAVRVVLLWVLGVLFFRSLGLPIERITNYTIWNYGFDIDSKTYDHVFKVSMIINSVGIYLLLRTILWIILQFLGAYYRRENKEEGTQYAINRLVKYVIFTIMTLVILEVLGFKLTVLWGGAAALLVGFGLGLQQTFNDLFSGILIMIEGSIHVGDMVRVKGEVGKVRKIGVRTSEVLLRDDVEIIVPNSHLVMDSIANWNHSDHKARFTVKVGVAYGSDTALVKKILLDIAAAHPEVEENPAPLVHFADFGSSSLDFNLHFWTFDVFGVLNTQSDLRFEIDKAFREHKISIPFPQHDVWIRGRE
jgi:small-conductance mechanosensitive channel